MVNICEYLHVYTVQSNNYFPPAVLQLHSHSLRKGWIRSNSAASKVLLLALMMGVMSRPPSCIALQPHWLVLFAPKDKMKSSFWGHIPASSRSTPPADPVPFSVHTLMPPLQRTSCLIEMSPASCVCWLVFCSFCLQDQSFYCHLIDLRPKNLGPFLRPKN